MRIPARAAAITAVALLAASCATTGERRSGASAPPGDDVAALSRAIAAEGDGPAMASLLYRRGHRCLEEAERVRGPRPETGVPAAGSVPASRLLLCAMRDFEDVTLNFPGSPEAPEALFHLGVVYDYPHLASFAIARRYYLRTIETYPGSEDADRARAAVARLDAAASDVESGRHGGR